MLVCLPLAAPTGLSPLHIPTLCGSECGLVMSVEPLGCLVLFDYSGVGCPRDGLLPVPLTMQDGGGGGYDAITSPKQGG